MENENNYLTLRKLGIDSYTENIVYMRFDCPLCLSEGFKAETRVVVTFNLTSIVATLNVITSDLLYLDEASLSEIGFERLGATDGDKVKITHLEPIESLASVRAKIYGNTLNEDAYYSIIHDIIRGRYSDIQLSAFITACSGEGRMHPEEIISLTKAMISTGETIQWPSKIIADKHCIGGIPGNRTTPIVVPIVAEFGLCIPKTSSRAITSPAGTADVMEVMTRVDLGIEEMKKVVALQNGCLAWGGAVKLSPADDILIQVERALNIDSEAQLIASVLSKKAAAGATHALLDIPIGPTAKVRSWEAAQSLKKEFENVAKSIGISVKVLFTDGSQPIGKGIGPSLEAMDVLAILRNEKEAPADLRKKSLEIAAEIIELSGEALHGKGLAIAEEILSSGKAYKKFIGICEAQGYFREPKFAPYSIDIISKSAGTVTSINNRILSLAAKLAGAPLDKEAGIQIFVHLGTKVQNGDLLLKLFSSSEGTLEYAREYLESHHEFMEIK